MHAHVKRCATEVSEENKPNGFTNIQKIKLSLATSLTLSLLSDLNLASSALKDAVYDNRAINASSANLSATNTKRMSCLFYNLLRSVYGCMGFFY